MRNDTSPRSQDSRCNSHQEDGSVITDGYLILSDREVNERIARVEQARRSRRWRVRENRPQNGSATPSGRL